MVIRSIIFIVFICSSQIIIAQTLDHPDSFERIRLEEKRLEKLEIADLYFNKINLLLFSKVPTMRKLKKHLNQ